MSLDLPLEFFVNGEMSLEEAISLEEATQSKIDYLVKKYVSKAPYHDEDDFTQVVIALDEFDPTHGKYLEWLVKMWIKGDVVLGEDEDKVQEALQNYSTLKNSPQFPQQHKDINRFGSYGDLARIIDQYSGAESKQHKYNVASQKGAQEIAKDGDFSVIKITTAEAAAELCKGTHWCVKDPKYYNMYGPPFYLVMNTGKPFVLIHHTGTMKDVYDGDLSADELLAIAPVVRAAGLVPEMRSTNVERAIPLNRETIFFFRKEDIKTPEQAYFYLCEVEPKSPEVEKIILKRPDLALIYAKDENRGQWPELEPLIADSPALAYQYAVQVSMKRFPLGEVAIATNDEYAYYYALYVRGRFPEGEPTILKGFRYVTAYARSIIEGRWPEAEKKIVQMMSEGLENKYQDVVSAYILEQIREPWPEIESFIIHYSLLTYDYIRALKKIGVSSEERQEIDKGPEARAKLIQLIKRKRYGI